MMGKTYIAILVELSIGGTRFNTVHQLRVNRYANDT
nr:MAG TPA: hypothetical protein [Bacteriophage sp.]